jgi:hypothetical protein
MSTITDNQANGTVRCWCGCKYWTNGKCVDCHTSVTDFPDQIKEALAPGGRR